MTCLLHDVRIAVRALLQRPGFALLAILTLAVGAGATTVIFTVLSGVLLKPLVVPLIRRRRRMDLQRRNSQFSRTARVCRWTANLT